MIGKITKRGPISSDLKTQHFGDFPGGPVVKNPPYNAGDVGLIPGQGTKIPHATGQLSLRATTRELARLKLEGLRAAKYRAHVLWTPPCHN